jgi:hypothetical protein
MKKKEMHNNQQNGKRKSNMRYNYYQHLIHYGLSVQLNKLPSHDVVECIDRITWPNFPYHLAIHRINDAEEMHREYAKRHRHSVPEINMIIGEKDNLVYQIVLGDEEYIVKSPGAIWVPPGLKHSANVIKGNGLFFCLLFTDKYEAMI